MANKQTKEMLYDEIGGLENHIEELEAELASLKLDVATTSDYSHRATVKVTELEAELTQIDNLCNQNHKAECECVTCQILKVINPPASR